MKKNKFQKGKSLAIAVFGLAAVAVVGVGFSSWVISFNRADKVDQVNLKVAEVKDNSVAILNPRVTGNATNNLDKFVFDADKDVAGSEKLKHGTNGEALSEATDANNLAVEFQFYLGVTDKLASGTTFDVSAVMTMTKADVSANYNLAVDKEASTTTLGKNAKALKNGSQYLVAPLKTSTVLVVGSDAKGGYTNITITKGTEKVAESTDLASDETSFVGWKITPYTVKVSFAWGAAFGGANPVTYFNTEANSANATHDIIVDTLNQLSTIDGATFEIVLTPSIHA